MLIFRTIQKHIQSSVLGIRKQRINAFRFTLTEPVQIGDHPPSKFQLRHFSDRVRLLVCAGKGGQGSIAHYTDKRIRRGAPDGGCGGIGGDIVLEAHSTLHDLSHLRRRTINGNNGGGGGIRFLTYRLGPGGRDGKNGGKTVIRVPCGTILYEVKKTEDDTEHKDFIVDLGHDMESIVIVNGGSAGKGNKRHPFMAEDLKHSKQGQTKTIFLELKTLADVGLVGHPNIGKSTFLAAVSRALPKIANYQFTTLKPSVGYVKFVDDFTMTIADIPGIIQDAHLNKGLGFQFLKHIQRTKVLIFMLDVTMQDPLRQYRSLEKQLYEYNRQKFIKKKRVIVFNKSDRLNDTAFFEKLKEGIDQPAFLISAKEGDNVGDVLVKVRQLVQTVRKEEEEESLKLSLEEKYQF